MLDCNYTVKGSETPINYYPEANLLMSFSSRIAATSFITGACMDDKDKVDDKQMCNITETDLSSYNITSTGSA